MKGARDSPTSSPGYMLPFCKRLHRKVVPKRGRLISPQGKGIPGGGTCQNFDRDARPIFLGLKFGQILFFWVGKFFSYFSGFCRISSIFWV